MDNQNWAQWTSCSMLCEENKFHFLRNINANKVNLIVKPLYHTAHHSILFPICLSKWFVTIQRVQITVEISFSLNKQRNGRRRRRRLRKTKRFLHIILVKQPWNKWSKSFRYWCVCFVCTNKIMKPINNNAHISHIVSSARS